MAGSETSAPTTRGRVRTALSPKRVRAYLGGRVVADTLHPLLVWEVPYYPTYYIPEQDIRAELVDTGATEHSPSRGTAAVCDILLDGLAVPRAASIYRDSPIQELRSHVRLAWDAMDGWMEEDEPVFTHPRDPYTRVDILASSRRIQVSVDGVEIADSDQPRILFETGLPPRYYLPLTQVRFDLFLPSDTVTHCPYKGEATYWSVDVNGSWHQDLVWTYRTPLPESVKIAGLVSFYNEKVDVTVDGEAMERPKTHFS